MDSNLSTLPYQLPILLIQKFRQIPLIFGLTSHCSQCFMPDNIFLIIIFDTFPNQALILIDANLSQNEAYLMLQEAALGFVVFFCEEEAEGVDGGFGFFVTQVVHQTVFLEQGELVGQHQTQIVVLLVLLGQVFVGDQGLEFGFGVWGGWLHCSVVVQSIVFFQFGMFNFLQGNHTGIMEFLTSRVNIFPIILLHLWIKIIPQRFRSLMPRQCIFSLVHHPSDQEFPDKPIVSLLQLAKSIQQLMFQEHGASAMGVGIDEGFDGLLVADIFQLKD